MDGLAKIDRDELVRRMREDFENTLREVGDAVNNAPDGHLIDGSEERVRDLLGDFRQRAFQTAVQMRVEATDTSAAFSPGEAETPQPRAGGAVDPQLPGPSATATPAIRTSRRPRKRSAR